MSVEIDESVISKRKYDKVRVLRKEWVVGGLCRETKKLFVEKVEKQNERVIKKSSMIT